MVVYQIQFENRADADAAMTLLEEASMEGKIEHPFGVDLQHEDDEGE